MVFSGGKDSTFAMYNMLREWHEIKYLITLAPKRADSYMFHVPDIKWTTMQAKALGIPQLFREVSGEKEREVEELKAVIEPLKGEIDGIVSGAIASTYQRSRIDRICEELGLLSIAPLWGINQEKHVRTVLESNFRVIITGAFAEGLGENWLGRQLDEDAVNELVELNKIYGINISGEGGEYESFVLDCPIFRKRLEIKKAEKVWDRKEKSGYLDIQKIELTDKIS